MPAVNSVGDLHAVGPTLPRGIDDCDVPVRVGAEPFAVETQGRLCRGEVPVCLPLVLRLEQQPHLHRREPGALEPAAPLQQVGARRPREVVHVVLHEAVRGLAARAFQTLRLDARRADHPAARHRDPHVVHAVVGEELSRGMELVSVPA